MMENVGSNGRKSPVQTILILLVESGLVFLGLQASHFYFVHADMWVHNPQILTVLADCVLGFECGSKWS